MTSGGEGVVGGGGGYYAHLCLLRRVGPHSPRGRAACPGDTAAEVDVRPAIWPPTPRPPAPHAAPSQPHARRIHLPVAVCIVNDPCFGPPVSIAAFSTRKTYDKYTGWDRETREALPGEGLLGGGGESGGRNYM